MAERGREKDPGEWSRWRDLSFKAPTAVGPARERWACMWARWDWAARRTCLEADSTRSARTHPGILASLATSESDQEPDSTAWSRWKHRDLIMSASRRGGIIQVNTTATLPINPVQNTYRISPTLWSTAHVFNNTAASQDQRLNARAPQLPGYACPHRTRASASHYHPILPALTWLCRVCLSASSSPAPRLRP